MRYVRRFYHADVGTNILGFKVPAQHNVASKTCAPSFARLKAKHRNYRIVFVDRSSRSISMAGSNTNLAHIMKTQDQAPPAPHPRSAEALRIEQGCLGRSPAHPGELTMLPKGQEDSERGRCRVVSSALEWDVLGSALSCIAHVVAHRGDGGLNDESRCSLLPLMRCLYLGPQTRTGYLKRSPRTINLSSTVIPNPNGPSWKAPGDRFGLVL